MNKFGIIGSGWRAEFYLRVAKFLPQKFQVVGLVTRNTARAAYLTQEYGIKCYSDVNEMLEGENPPFVVVSINASASTDLVLSLLAQNVAVLMETPPATSYEDLNRFYEAAHGAKIQIAENYPFQPMHKARLEFINSGKLGNIQQTQITYTHGFHAFALMRKYLGIGFEDAEIFARSVSLDVLGGFTRDGEPKSEEILTKKQTFGIIEFGKKTGIYNFEMDQHRSWIRTPLIHIKGDRGEVFNTKIKYMADYKTPVETEIVRKNLGQEDFEGFDLKGIFADSCWLYRNPYQGSRLSDDEIAVAHLLKNMDIYLKTGKSSYALEDALHDVYLSLLLDEAAKNNKMMQSKTQAWGKI